MISPTPTDRDIRIERFDAYPIRLPLREVHSQGIGDVGGATTCVIVRVETNTGAVGWGEAAPWAPVTGSAEACVAALRRYYGPMLLGSSPFAIRATVAQGRRLLKHATEALAAVEMALFDLVGKILGTSVSNLLGGRVRDEIPLSFSIANPLFEKDIELAQELYAEGIRIFKLKTGFSNHRNDLARLEKLRRLLGDEVEIRIDYNQALEPHSALRQLRDIEGFGVGFIEQPVPAEQIECMAHLAASLDTPVMADESVFGVSDTLRIVQAKAADLISVKTMKAGGLLAAQDMCAIAEASGIACYGGTMLETGIASTAGAHLMASSPNATLGCEYYQPTYYLVEDILAAPFAVRNGMVQAPDGPGLGVAVDEDKIRFYGHE